ncbi:hypothetical protein Dsin_004818 [Dipteronia sinensis]|uniref:RNase H type-1 domain-containing protein n=1 Tax=Dipteronia sinensis TaxID=43782 RepID=A0AAE0AVA6_9ROSI|nr:hypothetical protein Dsin_004818 [Dipteronia sinensis]
MFSILSKADLALFYLLTWALWENRNALFRGERKASRAASGLGDGFTSGIPKHFSCFFAFSGSVSCFVWIPPPPSVLKLNSAVVLHNGSPFVGLGIAIRSDRGKVILASSNTWLGSFSAKVGGFIALREGLLLAKFYNISVRIAESECLVCGIHPKLFGDFFRGCFLYR